MSYNSLIESKIADYVQQVGFSSVLDMFYSQGIQMEIMEDYILYLIELVKLSILEGNLNENYTYAVHNGDLLQTILDQYTFSYDPDKNASYVQVVTDAYNKLIYILDSFILDYEKSMVSDIMEFNTGSNLFRY